MRFFRLLIPIASLALLAGGARGDEATVDVGSFIVCPATDADAGPPDFTGPACRAVAPAEVDPQGRMIWVKANVVIAEAKTTRTAPLGLFVSGKGAREVYVNGVRLGADGVPAATKSGETPGAIDTVFYLPPEAVRAGVNAVVIRMSAHYGPITLRFPFQGLAIGEYQAPRDAVLRHYWTSLLTFGVFAIGVIYFGAMALMRRDVAASLFLTLISLFAAGQLLAEVARGLTSYAYPLHEWRVLAILMFSAGFGLCLGGHVILRFMRSRRVFAFGVIVVADIVVLLLVRGFDGMSAAMVFVPTILCALGLIVLAMRGRTEAIPYAVALAGFIGVFLLFPFQFLDSIFFFSVAALLLFLFAQQARALALAEAEERRLQARARDLEQALATAAGAARPTQIRVKSAGSTDIVEIASISHCSGAGDYVELFLKDGGSLLYGGSLNELEDTLPPSFLRVHRSHIVNADDVRSLTREPSGVGRLEMRNGASVPVSRRIMPKVRGALA